MTEAPTKTDLLALFVASPARCRCSVRHALDTMVLSRSLKLKPPSVAMRVTLLLLASLLYAVHAESATVEQPECAYLDSEGECIDVSSLSNEDILKETTDPFSLLHGSPLNDDFSLSSIVQSILGLASHKEGTSTLDSLFQTARNMTSKSDKTRSTQDMFDLFFSTLTQVMDTLKRQFELLKDSDAQGFNLFSLWYYLEHEDERKNPSWKRRKHRYNSPLKQDTAAELHNALYLSHLAYADTAGDIKDGLEGFLNNTYELIYSQMMGLAKEPAHFMAIKKQGKPKGIFPWQVDDSLDVLLVVRGTKTIDDMLTDGLLEADDYRGGKAHAGIAESGKYLVEKHLGTLQHLLEVSSKKKIRLSLVGHSLGAGSAAIAAIEYNEYDMIEATSIGFGCPALLSLNISESTKDFITTVVADSDVVPRLSGATMANMFLDILSYDFTQKAHEDLQDFLLFLNSSVPINLSVPMEKILSYVQDELNGLRPAFTKVFKERLAPVLFPPGTCIHLFRDGSGFTGSYTPCDFFDSIDFTRTLIDDHMTLPGYHKALLHFLRDKLNNDHFDFQHDIAALPIT